MDTKTTADGHRDLATLLATLWQARGLPDDLPRRINRAIGTTPKANARCWALAEHLAVGHLSLAAVEQALDEHDAGESNLLDTLVTQAVRASFSPDEIERYDLLP